MRSYLERWLPRWLVPALLLLMACVSGAVGQGRVFTDPVDTDRGPVTGEVVEGVDAFRGIPFAAPPVGRLRWCRPQPPQPWTKPLLATAFGPACPQLLPAHFTSTAFYGPVGALSEDCLYLNVWRPVHATRAPVLVWLHGGRLLEGSGSQPCFDGATLARTEGLVVVTANYRLGAFGFYAENDVHRGNYGMWDMVAALQWVHANIARFGGDPSNVTVASQTGAIALMASPPARGLFQRVAAHSCPMPTALHDLREAIAEGEAFRRRLPPAPTWIDIVQTWQPKGGASGSGIEADLAVDGDMLAKPSHAFTLDDEVLPVQPSHAFADGTHDAVPLLIGTDRDEGTVFQHGAVDTLAAYAAAVRRAFPRRVDEVLAAYPARTDPEARAAYTRLETDVMRANARQWARWNARRQPRTYLFEFARTPRFARDSWLQCFHGLDLAYLFGRLDGDYDDTDRRVSADMMARWAAFARTGDPDAGRPTGWPRFDGAERLLVIDAPCSVGTTEKAVLDRIDRWKELP